MMKMTLKDIINKGEKGQIWESCSFTIFVNENGIEIKSNYNEPLKSAYMSFEMYYTLMRISYDFDVALREYRNGKEIESTESKTRYKRIDDKNYFLGGISGEWVRTNSFAIRETEGKWYIND